MSYILRGHLCGYLCADCREDLSDVTVRLYRPEGNDIQLRAAANAKETFNLLSEDDVEAKEKRLLGEGRTDENGTFSVSMDGQYDGEAVEVDVYCGTVPGRKPPRRGHGPKPLQFSITTIQPSWSEGNQRVAEWKYCIPSRYWCTIRGRFGAWVICGHVTVCETGQSLPGVTVKAFDVDWLQDDALGTAVTDAGGHFRIDYNASDFRKTIFPGIQIEWFGGPDVYFHILAPGGATLLQEAPARGREPDRENVFPCFCVPRLCVPQDTIGPVVGTEPAAVFDRIGTIKFLTDINSTPAGDGLTVSDGRAFFSDMPLRGALPKKLNGVAAEYTFQWQEVAPGAAPNPALWQPAPLAPTTIGMLQNFDPTDPGNPWPTRDVVIGAAPGPNQVAATVTADGWIQVPQASNNLAPEGFFYSGGYDLFVLHSEALGGWDSIDLAGLVAGQSVTSTGHPLARKRWFALRMLFREVGNPASAVIAGTCRRVAIDNTVYRNLQHHPNWGAHFEATALAVALLDIQELVAAGCAKIKTDVHVRFTAAHPYLGNVWMTLSGPGTFPDFALELPVDGQRFGGSVPAARSVAALPRCAYIVDLFAELLLTTGVSIPNARRDRIAFCTSD
jgi:hypothetical protein